MNRILITGGSGYIGSHVVKILDEYSYEPIVFDIDAIKRFWATPNCAAFAGNITNKWQVDSIFEKYKFDAVIHLAATTEVSKSLQSPLEYYTNNVLGTSVILEACVKHNVNKVIFGSSSTVYGPIDIADLPTQENHIKSPIHAYGSSKLAAESMIRDVAHSNNINCVTLRYFNASGAALDGKIGEFRKRPSHLIPNIQQVLEGKSDQLVINGNNYRTIDGTAVRDFTHVWDIARAHVHALEYLNNGGKTDIFNIGGGKPTSVLQMIHEFEAQCNRIIPYKFSDRRNGDVEINYADNSKAKNMLNWEPQHSDIKFIVRDAIQWYCSDLYQSLSKQSM